MKVIFENVKKNLESITSETPYPYIVAHVDGGGVYLVVDKNTVICLGNKNSNEVNMENHSDIGSSYFFKDKGWYLYDESVTLSN